ncbi:hypothetical protein COBT_001756 [Conglomerata obtusa]
MLEQDFLERIFLNNVRFTTNEIIITTAHGIIKFTLPETYPKNFPEIKLTLNDKERQKEAQSEICKHLDKFKGRYMIYPIVYHLLSIIEGRKGSEQIFHLDEVNEITEEVFNEWKKSRQRAVVETTQITGKEYFLKMMSSDRKIDDE